MYYVNLPHHIRAFDVADGSHLVNDRLFAVVTPGIPDGLKTDSVGCLLLLHHRRQSLLTAGALARRNRSARTANFCFGCAEGNILFMLNDTGTWAATLAARGA